MTRPIDELLADVATEVARQERVHPAGYPATHDGVFLGIQTAVHELQVEAMEAWAMEAWRAGRCRCEIPLCGHADWRDARAEMLQAAAVILRTVRAIDERGKSNV